eukprot:2826511-Rhodomonas_salina.2
MVRAAGSARNKQFAVAFVYAMSVPDYSSNKQTIGRSGGTQKTVHDLLRACYPETTRDEAKDGVTSCEMNKALEKEGFERVRVRLKKDSEIAVPSVNAFLPREDNRDDTVALYRFKYRRWLNPEDPQESSALYASWCELNKVKPAKITFQTCCQHVRAAVEADISFILTHPRSIVEVVRKKGGSCSG